MKRIGAMTLGVPARTISGRLGDDTLFVVLADVDVSDATGIARQLLDGIRNGCWSEDASDLYVTCSAGVAQFARNEQANTTVTRAAQGLKVAINSGGNRVVRGPKFVAKGMRCGWEHDIS